MILGVAALGQLVQRVRRVVGVDGGQQHARGGGAVGGGHVAPAVHDEGLGEGASPAADAGVIDLIESDVRQQDS